jgi:uncharacterized membrane protein YqiK
MIEGVVGVGILFVILVSVGLLILLLKCYHKVEQGQALVRNGMGGTKVSFAGIYVIPILHKAEIIDISVKRVSIDRADGEGLICRDNMRADIKVAFFVRVNKTQEDVLRVAQSIGCERASHREALQELFEAKFSEGLKTVGKQFEFVELYNSREQFKEEILKTIGTDLNGFVLDDAAIDFLEQTSISKLDPDNILDSEGIKKISELTAEQKIRANEIEREKEKTIMKQDVEAREAILELKRQQADAENQQKRKILSVQAREEAETKKIQEEERLKSEMARIGSDEDIFVAEENMKRQIIVAEKNKERTEAVETERVIKDRDLEITERERIVALATIEKDKAIEVEKKAIQDVIRERVIVEKTVVEEQERIKDTEAFAKATREKRVAITDAEKEAEQSLVMEVKSAEASKTAAAFQAEEYQITTLKEAEVQKQAAEFKADEVVIAADAEQSASERHARAKIVLAEALKEEEAAPGLAEVSVTEANDLLIEKRGTAVANALEMKLMAEAKGISEKAEAMKKLDGVGRDHEEFKLEIDKSKEIELAEISTRKDIAGKQAQVLGEALKNAKVDIVGGEAVFFDKITEAVSGGKAVDRYVGNSKVLSDVKETFFNADPDYFDSQLKQFFSRFNLSAQDVKDLSVSAALSKLVTMTDSNDDRSLLYTLMSQAERAGKAGDILGNLMSSSK